MQKTRIQVLDNVADLLQPRQHRLITVHKRQASILDAALLRKLPDQLLASAQIVPRDSRKQMMNGLELQTAVEPVQPLGAVNVHGCAELVLRERLGGSKVGSRHAPVRQGDLDVEDDGDDVGSQDESNAVVPGGQCAPDEQVAENVPVAAHEGNFSRASPPRSAELLCAWGHEMEPA